MEEGGVKKHVNKMRNIIDANPSSITGHLCMNISNHISNKTKYCCQRPPQMAFKKYALKVFLKCNCPRHVKNLYKKVC